MNRKAILCVDDEAIIVLALKQELLNHFGKQFIYESAMSAEDAMRIIDELSVEKVDVILIITDWLMPGIKGDDFLIRIRDLHPEIRSIMVTGQADEAAIERAKELAGVAAVLRKPWTSESLVNAIRTCIPDANHDLA